MVCPTIEPVTQSLLREPGDENPFSEPGVSPSWITTLETVNPSWRIYVGLYRGRPTG